MSVDLNARIATQMHRLLAPNGGITSYSQRTICVMRWGDKAWFSEVEGNDDRVLAVTSITTPDTDATAMNYRAYSFEWQSMPGTTKLFVWSYALNSTAVHATYSPGMAPRRSLHLYCYGAAQVSYGLVVMDDTGHEESKTMWVAPAFSRWQMGEAMRPGEASLGNSTFQPMLVPSETPRGYCDELGCTGITAYAAM